ncbi:MAG: hypothetical protein JW837_18195 [Sedimentisphaerales bacterium]|nr:hypothetical protein [Sedimentisphaerales bacterium]
MTEKVKVKYVKNVQSPPESVGRTGEVREMEEHIADRLLKGGYVEIVKAKKSKE